MDRYQVKISLFLSLVTFGTGVILLAPVLLKIRSETDTWVLADRTWILIFPLILFGTAMLFKKKLITSATLVIALAAILTSWGINPLYKGLYPLHTTVTGKAINEINSLESGNWIGVGGFATRSILTQAGVQTLSGVQNYPIQQIWTKVDPEKIFENQWNRLGHIYWELSDGKLEVYNPQDDVISVRFNPCLDITRNFVMYVFSDSQLDEERYCLKEVIDLRENQSKFWVYKIRE
jgi:hypothetical protein